MYKKVGGGGDMFLLVSENKTTWAVSSSTKAYNPFISSGRATNSPNSPEAGASIWQKRTDWVYMDDSSKTWVEGGVKVTCVDPIVLSSTGKAAEQQGGKLGEFLRSGEHNGRPFYLQRDTEGRQKMFLYSAGGMWWVSQKLGETREGEDRGLKNEGDTDLPMASNWLFFNNNGRWERDTSLRLEFTSLSTCEVVGVTGKGDVVEKHGGSLGNYRFAFAFPEYCLSVHLGGAPKSKKLYFTVF